MNRLDELVRAVCQNGVNHIAIGQLIKQKRIIMIAPSIKIKRNDYLVDGATPIISQEAEYISGYCNLADKNIPKDNYVCFGDHSEHIKFIDFAFVQGADGLKIMRTDETVLSTRYLFHAASNFYCRHNNYERHFKYFADTIIPLPPLAVQQEIVRILDSFTELTAELNKKLTAELTARRKQYEHYRDELLTFGDDVLKIPLCKLFNTRNGYTPSKTESEFWSNGTVPWFRMEDIRENGRILDHAIQSVSSKAVKGKPFPANSIIVATSATIGEHALLTVESLANQRFTYLMVKDEYKEKVNIKYLFYYCFLLDKYCLSCLNQGNFASVDMTKFNKFLFAVPSIEDQNHIVAQLDRFNALCNDLTSGLPAEIAARQKQYEYYRDKLLTFKERETN